MNIIVNGFMDQRTLPIIQKVIEELNVKSFVYTYHLFKPDFGRFNSKATLISWQKINFFGDYDIDFNNLGPLDEEIVDSMRKCEAVFLKMMDRLETLKNYSYRERKGLYLKHLRYWNDLVERKKIDLFISQNVPHETSDFVCYSLCKIKKIPTLMLFQTHIPDTCFICDDWENSDYGLPKEYKKLKEQFSTKKIDEIKLAKRFDDYYKMQTSLDGYTAPFYMDKKSLVKEGVQKAFSISRKLKNDPAVYFREGKIIARALWRRLPNFLRTCSAMSYYEKNCIKFDPKKKYIFVALHLQPEMSTSPRADVYVEQLLIVQLISACLPKGIEIFVKEHPNQKASVRTKSYYKSMLDLPNAKLISRKIGSQDLINNCLAVATCVGLAGFEGLFKTKPLLMFGHDFLQYSPGVFSIRTRSDLDFALKQILKGPTFSAKEFKVFLKATENVSINGTSDSDYAPTSTLDDSESATNIAQAILDKIKK